MSFMMRLAVFFPWPAIDSTLNSKKAPCTLRVSFYQSPLTHCYLHIKQDQLNRFMINFVHRKRNFQNEA